MEREPRALEREPTMVEREPTKVEQVPTLAGRERQMRWRRTAPRPERRVSGETASLLLSSECCCEWLLEKPV